MKWLIERSSQTGVFRSTLGRGNTDHEKTDSHTYYLIIGKFYAVFLGFGITILGRPCVVLCGCVVLSTGILP